MAMRDGWIEKREAAQAQANGSRNMSQMHLARLGVITEEMQYVATRERLDAGDGAQRSGEGSRDYSGEHSSPQPGADGNWGGVQLQDQCEHREFGDDFGDWGRVEETAPRGALRRGYGDGPFDRRKHSGDPAGDYQCVAGADRDRAGL